MEEQQVNLSEIKAVEGGVSIDLNKYDKKSVKIEKVEAIQVPSKFTRLIDETKPELGRIKAWSLKVQSEILETIGEGEDKVDFRASELFNLVQDKDGNLKGFPTGEGSNLMKFMKDLKIKEPEKLKDLQEVSDAIVGKEILIKSYDKDVEGNNRTYLKFRY